MRVAVVGAGIHGASTALALVERGHKVVLIDQFEHGHELGSSHGRSRIVRRAYPDAYYTEIMMEGYPLWAELEKKCGKTLVHECGLSYFGRTDSTEMFSMLEGLKELGVKNEILHRDKAAPIRLQEDEIAVFTPEAGWVRADEAIGVTLRLFQLAGGRFERRRVSDPSDLKGYDKFVLCCGPWIRKIVDVPVTPTLQTFCYIRGKMEGPVWIEDGRDHLYGFPSEPDSDKFKAGVHTPGRIINPDSFDRVTDADAVEELRLLAARRFGISDPQVVETKGCIYTNAKNDDFRFGRVGDSGFFASPCSGHGFKFGPWIGKTFADFVEGKREPKQFPRFMFP